LAQGVSRIALQYTEFDDEGRLVVQGRGIAMAERYLDEHGLKNHTVERVCRPVCDTVSVTVRRNVTFSTLGFIKRKVHGTATATTGQGITGLNK
jgi:hypothetical protein